MNKDKFPFITTCISFATLLLCSHTWDKSYHIAITGIIASIIVYLSKAARIESATFFNTWNHYDFWESFIFSTFPAYSILWFRIKPILDIHNTSILLVLWLSLTILLAILLHPIIKRINRFFADNSLHKLTSAISHIRFYQLSLCISSLILVTLFIFCFNGYIWLDEAFTMVFIEPSLSEMMKMLIADVHPPLYYLITKAFVEITGILLPSTNSIHLAKLVSLIPYIILTFWGSSIVRKLWGYTAAGIFSIAVIGTAPLADYSTEARMYSWAMLFVASTYLFAHLICRFQRIRHWSGFIICSLCAAYTHYYAIVAVIPSFAYVLFAPSIRLKNWLIACTIVVIAYSPWLPIFIEQSTQVRDNYWIAPINYGNVLYFVKYPVLGVSIMSAFLLLGYGLKECKESLKQTENRLSFPLVCLLSPYIVIIIGLLVSYLIRPMFIYRYILPTLGTFWMGLTLAICRKKMNATPILAIFVCLNVLAQFIITVHKEQSDYREHKKLTEFNSEHTKAVYIVHDPFPCFTLSVLTNNKVYHWKASQNPTFQITNIRDKRELTKALAEASEVYFISTSPDEQKQFTKETGLECKTVMQLRIGCCDTTINEVLL